MTMIRVIETLDIPLEYLDGRSVFNLICANTSLRQHFETRVGWFFLMRVLFSRRNHHHHHHHNHNHKTKRGAAAQYDDTFDGCLKALFEAKVQDTIRVSFSAKEFMQTGRLLSQKYFSRLCDSERESMVEALKSVMSVYFNTISLHTTVRQTHFHTGESFEMHAEAHSHFLVTHLVQNSLVSPAFFCSLDGQLQFMTVMQDLLIDFLAVTRYTDLKMTKRVSRMLFSISSLSSSSSSSSNHHHHINNNSSSNNNNINNKWEQKHALIKVLQNMLFQIARWHHHPCFQEHMQRLCLPAMLERHKFLFIKSLFQAIKEDRFVIRIVGGGERSLPPPVITSQKTTRCSELLFWDFQKRVFIEESENNNNNENTSLVEIREGEGGGVDDSRESYCHCYHYCQHRMHHYQQHLLPPFFHPQPLSSSPPPPAPLILPPSSHCVIRWHHHDDDDNNNDFDI